MKKSLWGIIICLFAILLYSCKFFGKNIEEGKVLKVKDISNLFDIKAKKLKTYKYEDCPGITYVNVEEFVDFMEDVIIDFKVEKDDELILSHSIKGENFTFKIIFNAEDDEIYINDFDLIGRINASTSTEYNTDLTLLDFELIRDNPAMLIDLSKYDIDIVEKKDEYYIPLYLANLFLTGDYAEVYEMNEYIYLYDLTSNLDELTDDFHIDKTKKVKDIRLHTKNYLALYFDYFYGLKEFNNVKSYKDVLKHYDFDKAENFNDLHIELNKFINSLDDLHTSIVTQGYMNENYEMNFNFGDKVDRFYSYYSQNQCYLENEEITYTNFEDYFIVKINAFTLNTKDLLKSIMPKADAKPIVIDLSCNFGGNVVAILELLTYLTSDSIPIIYKNPVTNTQITEFYNNNTSNSRANDFYILTSPVTFSAANAFTSIVKDLKLGVIIGEKSSGGASAVTLTTLPDGAIISNSSNMTFVNSENIIIEDGIDVDIEYASSSYIELEYYLDKLFYLNNEINTRTRYSNKNYSLDVEVNVNNDIFNIYEYEVKIYDNIDNEDSMVFKSDKFSFEFNSSLYNTYFYVYIIVRYNIKGIIDREEVIYHQGYAYK